MQAVNGVQSDSQAVSCVRVMVSGQLCQSDGQAVSGVSEWWSSIQWCLRIMVKQSVVSHSDGQAVSCSQWCLICVVRYERCIGAVWCVFCAYGMYTCIIMIQHMHTVNILKRRRNLSVYTLYGLFYLS